MMRNVVRGSIAGLCLLALVGCDDSNGGALTTPTTPSPSLNLAGTWSGCHDSPARFSAGDVDGQSERQLRVGPLPGVV
jgi:hypothetical protein